MSGLSVSLVQVSADIAAAQGAADSAGLGVGQSWQNMTASRALATEYTNSTGKAICLIVASGANDSLTFITATINSVSMEIERVNHDFNADGTGVIIVPKDSTYEIDISSGGLGAWWELR